MSWSSVLPPALALAGGCYLLGLSVTVAVVVYPSFALVGDAGWPAFHRAHSRRIARAVGPGWTAEGAAAAWWAGEAVLHRPVDSVAVGLALLHAVAAATTVALTLAVAVPVHQALGESGITSSGRARLVDVLRRAHAARTAAWAVAVATSGVGLLLAVRS